MTPVPRIVVPRILWIETERSNDQFVVPLWRHIWLPPKALVMRWIGGYPHVQRILMSKVRKSIRSHETLRFTKGIQRSGVSLDAASRICSHFAGKQHW
jgi:hypothetical protein